MKKLLPEPTALDKGNCCASTIFLLKLSTVRCSLKALLSCKKKLTKIMPLQRRKRARISLKTGLTKGRATSWAPKVRVQSFRRAFGVTVLDAAHDLTPFFRVHLDCCFAQTKPLFLLRLNCAWLLSGFGKHIKWMTMEDGLQEAKKRYGLSKLSKTRFTFSRSRFVSQFCKTRFYIRLPKQKPQLPQWVSSVQLIIHRSTS